MAWKRWRDRSQVERVETYTRQSLLWLLWFFPLVTILPNLDDFEGDVAALVRMALTVLLASILGTVVMTEGLRDDPPGTAPRWWLVVALAVVPAATLVGGFRLDDDADRISAVATWLVAVWALSVVRDRWAVGLLAVVTLVFPLVATGEPLVAIGAVGLVLFFVFTVRTSLWLHGVVRQLDVARGAQADLAVAEERLRFSRDVHDVLGRRLSAIAVQAELAATLADRGADGAAETMREVRATANDGLREARELARGYRSTDLTQEVDGARSLLASAGIDLDVRLDGLPAGWEESAGWVVRETLTNVLRHSDATRVTVGWSAPELCVVNDAPAPAPEAASGHGLVGLCERLEPLGAVLAVEHDPDAFTVRVTLPGDGPRTAP